MKTPILCAPSRTAGGGFAFSTNSATRYLFLGGSLAVYAFGYAPFTTEGTWRTTVAQDGVIDDFEVYISANTRTTGTAYTLMKNGVSTGYTATVGAGVTGWVGASGGPVAVAAGDLLSVRMVTGTGGGSITTDAIQSSFEADSGDTVAHYFVQGDYNLGVTLANAESGPLQGTVEGNGFSSSWGSTLSYEAYAARIQLDATATHISVDVPVNTATAAHEVELYVNNAASGLKATIPAGTTGRFSGTGSVNIAPGDALDLRHRSPTAATGALRIGIMQTALVYDGEAYDWVAGPRPSDSLQNYEGATHYIGPQLNNPLTASASAFTRFKLYEGTISNLWARVNRAAGAPGNWPVTELQVAGAQAITITVDGSVTGSITATNTTDTWAANDGDNVRFAFRTVAFSQAVSAWGFSIESGAVPPVVVDGGTGALTLQGQQPGIVATEVVTPGAGALALGGQQPAVAVSLDIPAGPGALALGGQQPDLFVGERVEAQPGAVVLQGQQPFIATEEFVAASQQAVIALAEPPPPPVRASQQAVIALGEIVPGVRASQQAAIVLATAVPCITYWCQVWIIRRLDGVALAFTSLDRPLNFHGLVAQSCASLMASATEGAANIGAVANMELAGIIDSDAISETDLWAGAYDGARVEVWLVPWAGTEIARRLAAGWAGKVSQGERGFSMEVLGPGARLEQQAITEPFTPACRWVFGDGRCPVDVDALKVAGVITGVANRRRFTAAALAGPPANPFTQGRVEFLTGANAGFRSETKDFDPDTGTFTLWIPAPQPFAPGDTFEAFPGCDKTKPTCQGYGAFESFGGFPDIPGSDSLTETPDAKY